MGASIRESQIRLLTPDQKEMAVKTSTSEIDSIFGLSPRRIREIIKKQQ